MIDTALAQVSDAVDGARNAVLENTTLAVALGATALVFYWFTKKIFKLALYAVHRRRRCLVLVLQHQSLITRLTRPINRERPLQSTPPRGPINLRQRRLRLSLPRLAIALQRIHRGIVS